MWEQRQLGRLFRWIGANRNDILIISAWTVTVTFVLSKAYLYFLNSYSRQGWYIPYIWPSLSGFDLALLLASSFIAGLVLTDAPQILYGYLISMFLSPLILIFSVFLYRWLEGNLLFQIAYGWEYVLYYIFTQVFWMMIPMGLVCCFLGALLGNFFKYWLTLK